MSIKFYVLIVKKGRTFEMQNEEPNYDFDAIDKFQINSTLVNNSREVIYDHWI